MAFWRHTPPPVEQPNKLARAHEYIHRETRIGFSVTQIVYCRRSLDYKPASFSEPLAIIGKNAVLPITIEFRGEGKGSGEIAFEMFSDEDGGQWVGMLNLPDERFAAFLEVCGVEPATEWHISGTIALDGAYSGTWHPVKSVEAERRRLIGRGGDQSKYGNCTLSL